MARRESTRAFTEAVLVYLLARLVGAFTLGQFGRLPPFWDAGVLVFAVYWAFKLSSAIGQFERANVFAAEWRALEAQGPEWHFENGSWFRVTFRRSDGSYKLDPTPRQKRMEAEIDAVRHRATMLTQCERDIVKDIIVAAVAFTVVRTGLWYFGGLNSAARSPGAAFAALFLLWTSLPHSLPALLAIRREKASYDAGNQFIDNPKVTDPLHEPQTLERVKEQTVLGNSQFVSRNEASRKLRS